MARFNWLIGTALGGLIATAAMAQEAPPGPTPPTGGAINPQDATREQAEIAQETGEIIVTARKRAETAFDTPVVLQAVGGLEMERRSINSVEGLSRVTPLLLIGENTGGIQGAPIAIRGIAGSEVNPFSDQAVSFNIDGIQISRSTVARLGYMDVASAEILKGPQALFYGKNSPGGVISLRTADPTSVLDSKLSVGYEFNGQETRAEGFISGPLADGFGIRVAGYYSNINGYVHNDAAPGPLKTFDRSPFGHEVAGRVTLKYDRTPQFTARLKFSYQDAKTSPPTAQAQLWACGGGTTPQFASPAQNCRPDNQNAVISPGAAYNLLNPTRDQGALFSVRNQLLTSLELNYQLTPHITLTSLTGLYDYHIESLNNTSASDTFNNSIFTFERAKYRDINQELRLLTSFDGWINVAAGGFYQSGRAQYLDIAYFTPGQVLTPLYNALTRQRGEAYSAFGQLILRPLRGVELSGGGRYSHEHKDFSAFVAGTAQTPLPAGKSWNNFSPEVTLKWSATPKINLFASYREGFLSGGYNGNGAANYNNIDFTYGQQTTTGWEAGIKTRLMDGRLRANFSVFDYDIKGLQVSAVTGIGNTQANAGGAYTRGAEFDVSWLVATGFTLRGAASYDKARYTNFVFNCYRGQSQAQGCNLFPNAFGVGQRQQLAGQQILRAPEWGASAGANYEGHVGKMKFGSSLDANYSASYYDIAFNEPQGRQPSYWLLDGSIRVGAADERWEIALIGRNLTNKYFVVRASEQPFTGTVPGNIAPGRQADIIGAVSRGREIMLRLTIRPHLF